MNSHVITISESSSQSAISSLSPDLYINFISFLDVKEKTADTYRKALKRLFRYFVENSITRPIVSKAIVKAKKGMSNEPTVKISFFLMPVFVRTILLSCA